MLGFLKSSKELDWIIKQQCFDVVIIGFLQLIKECSLEFKELQFLYFLEVILFIHEVVKR